ncbi:MAG: hypothetical protein CFH01_01676, partial [Alphaproteobacteria bacterium MarineAlpha2_Bin1]
KIRCIGWNQEISEKIGLYIVRHEKVGTYSLPWLHEIYPWSKSSIGECILHVDFLGNPFAVVQVLKLELMYFKEISQEHTNLDGPPVRDLNIWKKLHEEYWSRELKIINKKTTPEMPVVIEKFKCIFSLEEGFLDENS